MGGGDASGAGLGTGRRRRDRLGKVLHSYCYQVLISLLQFIAIRKTLEANMVNVHMYPPGRVLWAMRESDLHPHHRKSQPSPGPRYQASDTSKPPDKLRLFEVLDVEQVFSQLVFARNMLSAHLPHEYDRVLHDLL